MTAYTRSRTAVADILMGRLRPGYDRYEQARQVIDAYLRASNPYDRSETIYDDFYRLRTVAKLVLRTYDHPGELDAHSTAEAMEALRAALLQTGGVE